MTREGTEYTAGAADVSPLDLLQKLVVALFPDFFDLRCDKDVSPMCMDKIFDILKVILSVVGA